MTDCPPPTFSSNQYDNASALSEPAFEVCTQASAADIISSSENSTAESEIDWTVEIATWDTCYDIAKMHEKEGNLWMAAWFFEETVKKSQWIWGDDHHQTLADKHNLAWIYRRIPELAQKGWELMEDVLERKIRIWGADHPRTLRTKFNMACVYWHCGHREIALDWHMWTWEKRRAALGDEHDDTKLSLKWLRYMCPTQALMEDGQTISSA
jgi:hypothetical protein